MLKSEVRKTTTCILSVVFIGRRTRIQLCAFMMLEVIILRNCLLRHFENLIELYSWRLVDTALGISLLVFIVLPVFVFWLIGKATGNTVIDGEVYAVFRYILFAFYVLYIMGVLKAFCVCGAVNNRRRLHQLKEKLQESEGIDEKRREEIQKEIAKLTKQCDRILGEERKN